LTEDQVRRILAQLVEPPVFKLPPHRAAHTRHWLPWEKKGPHDRTLVFDTFVSVNRHDPVLVGWPAARIDADDRARLGRLLDNLGVLGRAEGWVAARCVPEQAASNDWNCLPFPATGESNPVPVLCADPASCFGRDFYPTPAKRQRGAPKPADMLFDCPPWHLCLDTQTIHDKRWSAVPGARWVEYSRPPEAPSRARAIRPPQAQLPQVARFLVDGPVLPATTQALPVVEAFRRAAMGCFARWCRSFPAEAAAYRRPDAPDLFASPILSGKDGQGTALTGQRHAYYLARPLAADPRRIGSVTLFARDGLAPAESAALALLHRVTTARLNLRVQLVGLGRAVDAAPDLAGPSATWRSATPFLGHGSIGARDRGRFLRKGLRREWRRLAQQVPEFRDVELRHVEELDPDEIAGSGAPQPREFTRARSRDGGREAYRPGAMFRIEFSRPICGPLSLGYASHFGMGLFVPEGRA